MQIWQLLSWKSGCSCLSMAAEAFAQRQIDSAQMAIA